MIKANVQLEVPKGRDVNTNVQGRCQHECHDKDDINVNAQGRCQRECRSGLPSLVASAPEPSHRSTDRSQLITINMDDDLSVIQDLAGINQYPCLKEDDRNPFGCHM
ncbi:hypothetical protein Glove_478g64 [Diversispora epigaea]|uniref:Uncharacterized protein n=1 Tax=Diversispora epigaea TaxID=1348612 RepID=A0A397GPK4_9GLOM|nr:hypothetical protein Glove_478g64 [Diversispora epigaea]